MASKAFVVVVALASAGACTISGDKFTPTGGSGGSAADASVDGSPDAFVPPAVASLAPVAGSIGGPGNLEGQGADAHFGLIRRVAFGSGTTYVVDQGNRTVRLVGSDGRTSTLSTTGGTPIEFGDPDGIAVDALGNVFVADAFAKVVWLVPPGGDKSEYVGSGSAARYTLPLGSPSGVALLGANLFITDSSRRVLFEAGPGSATRQLGSAFGQLDGVAVGSDGFVYVADSANEVIRRYNPATGASSVAAGFTGDEDEGPGVGSAARFATPTDVTFDASTGAFYILDGDTANVRKMVVNALGSGNVTAVTLSPKPDGLLHVAADGAGGFVVATTSEVLRVTSSLAVTSLAGSTASTISQDGSGSGAELIAPRGMCLAGPDQLYIAEPGSLLAFRSGTVRLLDLSTAAVTTPAWKTSFGSLLPFGAPSGVAFGSASLFIVDGEANVVFQAALPDTTYVVADGNNTGTPGSADGTAATFRGPSDIAIASDGTLYIADTTNRAVRAVANGSASTLLVTAGVQPEGVAVGSDGLYATYSDGTIRRIDFAGTTNSQVGSGASPPFVKPQGIVIDHSGNLFIADRGNSTIREITHDGQVRLLLGVPGESGIRLGSGSDARLATPIGLAIHGRDLLVTDTGAILVIPGVAEE